ncbi:MAG: hypothetical protein L3K17_04375 [Thermoplasmata archaeon]|nr:hypothetical protein [Thermoplasmata archaeon]
MAPTCTNCSGNDFVWANELKTAGGMGSAGGLSLRPRGEVPLGARICRTCGHAELFLRDLALLHQPASWKPGEFIPIPHKPKAAPAPAHHPHSAPEAPAPPEPAPTPTPAGLPAPEGPSPPPTPVDPEPAMPAPLADPMADSNASAASTDDPAQTADTGGTKPRAARRRAAKPKA